MLAAFHGPIEEQARLSIHPHMLIWFVSTTSEAWLRSILRRETEEARALLRGWQERVLAAVQSMQLDSAAVLPLLLTEVPDAAAAPRSTPFTELQQRQCKFDGDLEGDARDPDKRRVLVATEEAFVDHHIRDHIADLPAGAEPRPEYLLPLTGAQVSRMPRYRLLEPMTADCPVTEEERREEARLWAFAYSEDYRGNIAVGQIHQHKDTCFKYVIQQGLRKAKHCRFHFNHFVALALQVVENGATKVRDFVLARTGKDPVLPRRPGEPAPNLMEIDAATGEPIPIRPTTRLGPSVITDDTRGMGGRVVPVRYNPLEGSSNGPAQVATRGNLDYQDMRRTFSEGFHDSGQDALRGPMPTEAR